MQNEIYRDRKSRPPIVYGRDGFTTGIMRKADDHRVGCCGDGGRNCVAGRQRKHSNGIIDNLSLRQTNLNHCIVSNAEIQFLFLTLTKATSVSKLKVVNFNWIIHPAGVVMVTLQNLNSLP
jgi:hypothetical protein